MPRGVYPHVMTEARRASVEKNLAKGREPAIREKVREKLKKNAQNPEWRKKVGKVTKQALYRKDTREKYLNSMAQRWGYKREACETLPSYVPTETKLKVDKEYIMRFWARVDIKGPDECWEYRPGKRRRTYGRFWIGGRDMLANRFVLSISLGRFLTGDEQALHHCDNPPCCNPKHLFLGTNRDNVNDKIAKGRAIYSGRKLNMEKARKIRFLKSRGWTIRDLAKKFGVKPLSITSVVNNRTYEEE